jgi:hypothetical protein
MKTQFGLIFGTLALLWAAPLGASEYDFDLNAYIELMKESEKPQPKEITIPNTSLDGLNTNQLRDRVRELERSLREYELNNETPGWNGAGGGEYITNRYNPWFIGKKEVTWCIDHGGKENFSLTLEESKKLIEEGMNNFLPSINRLYTLNLTVYQMDEVLEDADVCGLWKKEQVWQNFCKPELYYSGGDGEIQLMSHNYKFVESCDQVDLEIILGNTRNKKIQVLQKYIGEDRFRNLAGVAIRTQYSEVSGRGKGFIYIAADGGALDYTGNRGIRFETNTIWDFHKNLSSSTPLPESLSKHFDTVFPKIKMKGSLKEHTKSPFLSVFTHEFGHVLGFTHSREGYNLMHEDFPANEIKNGLTFSGDFNRSSRLIDRNLTGFAAGAFPNGRIGVGVDMSLDFQPDDGLAFQLDGDQEIKELLTLDLKNKWDMSYRTLVFDILSPSKLDNRTGTSIDNPKYLKVLEVQTNSRTQKLEYKEVAKHLIELDLEPPTTKIEGVYFRHTGKKTETQQLSYDLNTDSWISKPTNQDIPLLKDYPLLLLRRYNFSGKIHFKNREITFKLQYTYGNTDYELVLDDKFVITVKPSDVILFDSEPLPTPTIPNLGKYLFERL